MKFEVGDIIGAYELLAGCGQGAYGEVFLAESTVTHMRVALKIVFRHGRSCERELRGLAAYQEICRRTDLLQVYHVEECGEYFYYTMDAADDLNAGSGEYVPDTLANRLRVSGRLPAEVVRKMADELVAGLNTLHDRGVLHRDVKPDNILWVDGEAKLGDIGLVTAEGATRLAGTPGFMPPEVLAGTREYEKQDDFHALGKVVYCALTGNPVEAYPSFPDSRTLDDCGDLVLLYNRLCGGEVPKDAGIIRQSPRSLGIRFAALILLVCAGAAAWFLLRPEPAKNPSAAPRTVSVPSKPSPPASFEDDIRGRRRREIDRMEKKYTMSAEFEKIRPRVARDYEYLCSCRGSYRRPFRRFYDPVTVEDQEFFDREHANDPVWQFGKMSEEIDADLKLLRDMSNDVLFDDASFKSRMAKCQIALFRRKKLETVLLKKYKTKGASAKTP